MGRSARFSESAWAPTNPERAWLDHERILKLRVHSHDSSEVDLVLSRHAYESVEIEGVGELVQTKTWFWSPSGPLRFPDVAAAERFLDMLGFRKVTQEDWNLRFLKHAGRNHRVDVSVSDSTVMVAGGEELSEEIARELRELMDYPGELKPLSSPLAATWIQFSNQ